MLINYVLHGLNNSSTATPLFTLTLQSAPSLRSIEQGPYDQDSFLQQCMRLGGVF